MNIAIIINPPPKKKNKNIRVSFGLPSEKLSWLTANKIVKKNRAVHIFVPGKVAADSNDEPFYTLSDELAQWTVSN